tara:strand:+ start:7177 stop:8142 length:966 start_codon:yes stop_codon:yes gene_type:complete
MKLFSYQFLFYNLILFIFTVFIYKEFIPICRRKLIDRPNSRSSHLNPTPTSGGIIFALLTTLISLGSGNLTTLISFPISVLGLIDDLKNVKPAFRYLSQLITIIILLIIYSSSDSFLGFLIKSYLFIIPIVVFFLSGIINFINFMDGIDGLVGGCMMVILIYFSINFNISYWPLIPTLLAFLIFNWSPSKIFMGDSGSLFLGSIYISALLQAPNALFFIKLLLLGSPLFIDSIICIVKRFLLKQNIFSPHKSHLYQRLVSAGFTHSVVSILYIGATILLSLVSIYFSYKILLITTLFIILLGIILDKYFAISFKKSIVSPE